MEDEAAGEVELDEIVGVEGGSGEGSDDDLDCHYDEEKTPDGGLREKCSRALAVDILGVVCVACTFFAVHGKIHHWRE